MLRISYNWKFSEKFSIRPGVPGIYHPDNDKYPDELKIRKKIPGSQGLTLNGNIFFNLEIGRSGEIEIALGTPAIVRKARPEGLTRSFVSLLEYKINFQVMER